MTLRPFDSAQGRPEFVEGRLAGLAQGRALRVALAQGRAFRLARVALAQGRAFRPFDSAQGRPEFVEGRLARAARALPVAPASVPAILLALWLVGAVVTWNVVFDARIVKGARDYVDRQQLFIDGRGPRQDMEQSMAAARAGGLRAAGLWSGVELAPGIALAGAIRLRSRRRAPAARPAASR